MYVHYREHDNSRYRVWSKEDADYGSFKVLTRLELQVVIRASTLMGIVCCPADDAHIDPIDMSNFMPGMIDAATLERENLGSS